MKKTAEEILFPTDMDGLATANLVGIAGEHADEAVLELLARHTSVLVRMAVAGNTNITKAVEVLLIDDSVRMVLEILDRNPSAEFRLRMSDGLRKESDLE